MTTCCKSAGDGGDSVVDDVKEYYGTTLRTADDLATPACKTPATPLPAHVRDALALVHDDVTAKYYGCGIVAPDCLEGRTVLDLGSGSGRDCFALSRLVGASGRVVGVDMTEQQLDVARRYVRYHQVAFGYAEPNVEFVRGRIEDLAAAGVADASVDVIISNCVVNLCQDKRAVLREAHRALRDGGELYFSDVYCDRALDDGVRRHRLLWNECVSGALHWRELFELAAEVGFETPRTVAAHAFDVARPDLKAVLGDAKFVSATYRLFKIEPPRPAGGASEALYDGEIVGCESALKFDRKVTLRTDRPAVLDGATAALLKRSRFAGHVTFRPAPACADPVPASVENPFDVVAGSGAAAGPGCCC